MTSIFDKWTELDFSLALRRIEAAHGSAIFDKFAYLDPQRAIRQIEEALDVDLDDVAGVLSFSGLDVVIDTAVDEDAGDDVPEWVPVDAKIFIDLVNDRAWTEADGEVAIDTLLGSDGDNTNNAWGNGGTYDPELLTVDGYAGREGYIAYIGAAKQMLLSLDGFTIVIKTKSLVPTLGNNAALLALVDAAGNNALEIQFSQGDDRPRNSHIDSWGGNLDLQIDNIVNYGTETSFNSFAATITPNRTDLAVNGSDAVTSEVTSDDYPTIGFDGVLTDTLINGAELFASLQSVTIYDALPSTVGLSALSETGVTNTAPIFVEPTVDNWQGVTGTSGFDATCSTGTFSAPGFSTVLGTGGLATDAQGNPVTLTVATGSDARISMDSGSVILTLVDPLEAGDLSFTIRATDPGGLYVEQEFTITVTA